jgi:uncharacterized protein (DUF2141 family)
LVSVASLAFALVASARAQETPDTPSTESRLSAEIRTNSDRGFVVCALFASATGFPSEGATRSVAHLRLRPVHHRVSCAFSGLAPGTYAISAFHDEDSDGELDTGLFGIPTEGWGTSRNAHGTMGPPSWADARFAYRGGAIHLVQPIVLNY